MFEAKPKQTVDEKNPARPHRETEETVSMALVNQMISIEFSSKSQKRIVPKYYFPGDRQLFCANRVIILKCGIKWQCRVLEWKNSISDQSLQISLMEKRIYDWKRKSRIRLEDHPIQMRETKVCLKVSRNQFSAEEESESRPAETNFYADKQFWSQKRSVTSMWRGVELGSCRK